MAGNNIKLKRSAVKGKIPTTANLELGELAVNTYDGYVYLKRSDGVTEEIVRIRSDHLDDQIIIPDTFTGDDVTTTFTLTQAPQSDEYSFITINGVSQHVDAYNITGTSLVFTEAPALGDSIEVRTFVLQMADTKLRDYQLYTYQPSTTTNTISGPDKYGSILTYDQGKIAVFLNGAKLAEGLDYTASNGTSVVLGANVGLGDTIEIESFSQAYLLDWDSIKPNNTALTTTTANQTIDTFDGNFYRTAKYIISMSHATAGYHSEEILLMHDGTNVYMTTYAQIWTTASLGTLNASMDGSVVKLTVTPANINTTIKLQRITVAT